MYARACCLRRAAVPFLGTIPGGTSRTRSLANRRPSARIDYGFFVGTSCEEGEKGSNLKGVLPKKVVLVWDCCGLSLEEIGELFGGAGYTAVSQMIRRTREKNHKGALKFKLAALVKKCVK